MLKELESYFSNPDNQNEVANLTVGAVFALALGLLTAVVPQVQDNTSEAAATVTAQALESQK